MKNILVILVTIGIGYAYWYQLPDAPATPVATPAATPPAVVKAPARRPAFIAAHTVLDEPATHAGGGSRSTSVLLGDDNTR